MCCISFLVNWVLLHSSSRLLCVWADSTVGLAGHPPWNAQLSNPRAVPNTPLGRTDRSETLLQRERNKFLLPTHSSCGAHQVIPERPF
ncbi:hypothetical protein CEXT_657211 [Caerostris extrusa]|uniref:Secreted protein n=1 Tax=Caerostris extrusa TaxID=172846 RepID=A0AAV4PPN9_CAEEX|nr:hypothetical protein CEXT_657211 [Caerostris extrusa]